MNAANTLMAGFGEGNSWSEVLESEQPMPMPFAIPCREVRRFIEPGLDYSAGACAGRLRIPGVRRLSPVLPITSHWERSKPGTGTCVRLPTPRHKKSMPSDERNSHAQ